MTPFQPNSGVAVLPSSTEPDSRSRATVGASSGQLPAASSSLLPRSVGQPAVSSRSLIEVGTPSNGPSGRPSRQRRSERAGRVQRPVRIDQDERVHAGSRAAIASSAARVASTGENRPRR